MKKINFLVGILCLATFGQIFSQAPIRGLKSFYLLNKDAEDFVGYNNGQIYGALSVRDRFGKEDAAYLFDGVDDHIRIDNPDFYDDSVGTFSAWVKFNSLNNIQYVAGIADEDAQNHYLSLVRFDPDSAKLSIYNVDKNGTNWVFGSTPIDTLSYYHVLMTGDTKKWELFINGKKEALQLRRGQNKGTWFNGISGIDNFIIGGLFIQVPHTPAFFNGIIDDVRIYNRVLDSIEISRLYTENICIEKQYSTIVITDTVKVYQSVAIKDTLDIDLALSGISELTPSILKVFPNPTEENIVVSIKGGNFGNQFSLKVFSNNGIALYNKLITTNEIKINMRDFGISGLYYLSIVDLNGQILDTKKIILR